MTPSHSSAPSVDGAVVAYSVVKAALQLQLQGIGVGEEGRGAAGHRLRRGFVVGARCRVAQFAPLAPAQRMVDEAGVRRVAQQVVERKIGPPTAGAEVARSISTRRSRRTDNS